MTLLLPLRSNKRCAVPYKISNINKRYAMKYSPISVTRNISSIYRIYSHRSRDFILIGRFLSRSYLVKLLNKVRLQLEVRLLLEGDFYWHKYCITGTFLYLLHRRSTVNCPINATFPISSHGTSNQTKHHPRQWTEKI